jgi:hypothetical protein
MPRKRRSGLASLFEGSSDEREQCDLARLLDRGCDHTLVSGARTGLAARADLAIFGNVLPKHIGFLIVNRQGLICAELTKLGLCEEATLAAAFACPLGSSIFSHLLLQIYLLQTSQAC